jgi:hypothetical protein
LEIPQNTPKYNAGILECQEYLKKLFFRVKHPRWHIVSHELINIINYKKSILALLIGTILIVIATQPPSGKRYYVAFSVRNNNEREITVRTTLAEPNQLFHVRPSDTFTINVAHDSAQPVFIQAVDRTTGTPITLNGKQSIILLPQDTLTVPQLYSAPNQCKLQLSLLLIHVYRIISVDPNHA